VRGRVVKDCTAQADAVDTEVMEPPQRVPPKPFRGSLHRDFGRGEMTSYPQAWKLFEIPGERRKGCLRDIYCLLELRRLPLHPQFIQRALHTAAQEIRRMLQTENRNRRTSHAEGDVM